MLARLVRGAGAEDGNDVDRREEGESENGRDNERDGARGRERMATGRVGGVDGREKVVERGLVASDVVVGLVVVRNHIVEIVVVVQVMVDKETMYQLSVY